MAKVIGVGGIFLKCRNKQATQDWYTRHLGMHMEDWGATFPHREADAPEREGYTVFSLFKPETTYFEPSERPVMFNLRVDDLDTLLVQLRAEGLESISEPVRDEFGKFAWVIDPEGNKIELWEPPH
jgi:catechol 2,3-dioxygenase-like lactoylglutathione lyase family enzyme